MVLRKDEPGIRNHDRTLRNEHAVIDIVLDRKMGNTLKKC